jgi:hypothetical protein
MVFPEARETSLASGFGCSEPRGFRVGHLATIASSARGRSFPVPHVTLPRTVGQIRFSLASTSEYCVSFEGASIIHISRIAIGQSLLSPARRPSEGIAARQATEAAHFLLANLPRHAQRFARAMHSRVASGHNADIIEHWARVLMEIGRMRCQ